MLLSVLLRHRGEVMSRTALTEVVWDMSFDGLNSDRGCILHPALYVLRRIGLVPQRESQLRVEPTGQRCATHQGRRASSTV